MDETTACRAPETPLAFLTVARARFVGEQAPESVDSLVAQADEVLAGRYRYFGYPVAHLPEAIDYTRDPFAVRSWPASHGKRLDYRTGEAGDPKWIWELNRLQELPLLAAAWRLTGDERYVRRGVELAERWLATTDPGRGIAWSNGYEAGMRAVSIALFLDALRGSTFLDSARAGRLVLSLWQHARWIRRDPSTHSSANNHLIAELSGLVAIGLLAPELSGSSDLVDHALKGLAREAERQIAADGTSVEQAFRYHLLVLDHLLVTVALLDICGRESPPEILGALERSGRALAAQLGESDPEPTYGDSDDGVVVRLSGSELRTGRAVAAGIAARLGDPATRFAASWPDVTACWLFGESGAERFARTEPEYAPGSAYLRDAGIVILRAGERRVMFDAGPLGYLAVAAHGHADALQVTVSDSGQDLVVDPGVGSYFARPDLRTALRGTEAHPTIAVDGRDQSESGGPFLWSRHAIASLLRVNLDAGLAVAEHDGYSALEDPVRHRRLVRVSADGPIVVVDRVVTAARHDVVQSWPLHPSLDVEMEGEVVRATQDGRPRLAIAVGATTTGRLALVRGQRDPLRGWYSRRLEHVEPAWLATWSTTAIGPLDIVALLWPLRGATWPDPCLELTRSPSELRIHYRRVDGTEASLRIDEATGSVTGRTG